MSASADYPHRRYNPLTGSWVLVSPHRTQRPWQGKQETPAEERRPAYDPKCYLCPRNERAGGVRNPQYTGTYVFTNDFPALLPEPGPPLGGEGDLLRSQPVAGTCRVVCFSPRHDLTLAEMPPDAVRGVVDAWAQQVEELGATYRWVQLFENRGETMGASNPHPHGQIWASDFIPNEAAGEDRHQLEYRQRRPAALLEEYLDLELKEGERIVVQNEHWVALVPFWAVWPFETMVLPRRHVLRMPDLDDAERNSLADLLRRLLTRYDNLFQVSFPYSMGWHGAPTAPGDYSHWQLHAHYYPPLLRSATVKKFMVGYEMLAEAQRDLTAEQAAERLRSLPEVRFSETRQDADVAA